MNRHDAPETGQIIASALSLPIDDRISLANAILESVEKSSDDYPQAEVQKYWADEIAVRFEDIESGKIDTVSSSEMWKRIGGKPNVESES